MMVVEVVVAVVVTVVEVVMVMQLEFVKLVMKIRTHWILHHDDGGCIQAVLSLYKDETQQGPGSSTHL